MPVAELLPRHTDTRERATRHPFLVAVRDGTLPGEALDAWLVQERRFVRDLLWSQARLPARAPRPAQDDALATGAAPDLDEVVDGVLVAGGDPWDTALGASTPVRSS